VLPVWQAVALGTLQGPAELLPVSSSGHIAVVPWLLGWDYGDLDDDVRKTFEVALHAGTAVALLIAQRGEVSDVVRGLDARRAVSIALTLGPPAVVGYVFERQIEEGLGTPASVATGLVVGAAVMALADRAPQERRFEEVGALDGLWLGVAQACALVPGVSRNGATLAAARLRRFARADAARLSWHAALPVIAGATALKGLRICRRRLPAGAAAPFAAGAGSAFVSTLAAGRLVRAAARDSSPLPYAVYRVALAALIVRRLVRYHPGDRRTRRPPCRD
jgi:undecaprenyl-diphosphatase